MEKVVSVTPVAVILGARGNAPVCHNTSGLTNGLCKPFSVGCSVTRETGAWVCRPDKRHDVDPHFRESLHTVQEGILRFQPHHEDAIDIARPKDFDSTLNRAKEFIMLCAL